MVISSPRSSDQPLYVFAGGGTGGHLYPALAIAAVLRTENERARFLFCGTSRSIDQRVLSAADYDVMQQPVVALHRAPWRWPKILAGFRRSRLMCRSHFERNRPAVVVGTGGLASVPALREALRLGIPTALLNPDAIPGRANRYLANSVDAVFAQWPETVRRLPSGARVFVTGCPVRQSLLQATRAAGIERFGLDARRKTLLVTGASQGARTTDSFRLYRAWESFRRACATAVFSLPILDSYA